MCMCMCMCMCMRCSIDWFEEGCLNLTVYAYMGPLGVSVFVHMCLVLLL